MQSDTNASGNTWSRTVKSINCTKRKFSETIRCTTFTKQYCSNDHESISRNGEIGRKYSSCRSRKSPGRRRITGSCHVQTSCRRSTRECSDGHERLPSSPCRKRKQPAIHHLACPVRFFPFSLLSFPPDRFPSTDKTKKPNWND